MSEEKQIIGGYLRDATDESAERSDKRSEGDILEVRICLGSCHFPELVDFYHLTLVGPVLGAVSCQVFTYFSMG